MIKLKQIMLGSLSMCSLLVSTNAMAADQSISVRLTAGASWQARNDVQIPNTDTGTRFSLFDAVGSGPVPAARVEFSWSIDERHGMRQHGTRVYCYLTIASLD